MAIVPDASLGAVFNRSIVLWADAHLVYSEGNKIQSGIDLRHPDSLIASYIKFCESQSITSLKFQRFSHELIKYLRGGSHWKVHKCRDPKGTYILNIDFA